MRQHFASHALRWPHNCLLCLKYFKTKKELDDHRRAEGHVGEVSVTKRTMAYQKGVPRKAAVASRKKKDGKNLTAVQSKPELDKLTYKSNDSDESTGDSEQNLRKRGRLKSKFRKIKQRAINIVDSTSFLFFLGKSTINQNEKLDRKSDVSVDSGDKTGEMDDESVESDDRTSETDDVSVESDKKTSESDDESADSDDKTSESNDDDSYEEVKMKPDDEIDRTDDALSWMSHPVNHLVTAKQLVKVKTDSEQSRQFAGDDFDDDRAADGRKRGEAEDVPVLLANVKQEDSSWRSAFGCKKAPLKLVYDTQSRLPDESD